MILQALKEYYDRKAADPDSDIAPEGWEWKGIPFVIVLDAKGSPVTLEDTREGTGRNRRAKQFLVPKAVIRTMRPAANQLWDNPEYALGLVQKGKPERVAEQHSCFKKEIKNLGISTDEGIAALTSFLDNPDKTVMLEGSFSECWKELISTPGANVTFRLVADADIIVRRAEVIRAIDAIRETTETKKALCLVTGKENLPVETLHPVIKGVWGAQSTGANIVSFNLEAFKSFGKEQGLNAPVSKFASFAYATALNRLLDKDSRQRIQVGDSSTVFWSDRKSDFENQIIDFFSEPPKDDPARGVEAVRALHESVQKGAYSVSDKDTRFYVLGLAPNAKRIAIRFWHVGTVPEMAARFDQHFQDLTIVHGPKDRDALSIFRLLVSTAVQGKADNIPPNLAGDTMRAILEGTQYPATLLQAAIRRNRAEQEVTYPRAAIIKASLNRSLRFNNPKKEKEITMSLDPENKNIGYRLGRLFAALEKVQSDANPGINATIRDRFYGAASSTPVSVFGNLIRLSQHHLSKLSDGLRIKRERQIQDIICCIGDFPAHLNMTDQGRFAIGYYHQMQDFYTKKKDNQ